MYLVIKKYDWTDNYLNANCMHGGIDIGLKVSEYEHFEIYGDFSRWGIL